MDATGYINTAVNIKDVSNKFSFDAYLISFVFLPPAAILCVKLRSLGSAGIVTQGSPELEVFEAKKWKAKLNVYV